MSVLPGVSRGMICGYGYWRCCVCVFVCSCGFYLFQCYYPHMSNDLVVSSMHLFLLKGILSAYKEYKDIYENLQPGLFQVGVKVPFSALPA